MAGENEKPPRAWQRMLSGRRLDLLNPSPDDIEIEDIAHGLARVARWNGQTVGDHAFSVAQHSLVVTDIVAALNPSFGNRYLLAALLHDAAEYVVGDLISPFKAVIGLDYKSFGIRLLAAIHTRFGIGDVATPLATAIKSADRIAAYFEATRLAGFSIAEANEFFGRPEAPEMLAQSLLSIAPWSVNHAQNRFRERFDELATMQK